MRNDEVLKMNVLLMECRDVIKEEERKNRVLKKMIFVLMSNHPYITEEMREKLEMVLK